jgi:hypothetical protein
MPEGAVVGVVREGLRLPGFGWGKVVERRLAEVLAETEEGGGENEEEG